MLEMFYLKGLELLVLHVMQLHLTDSVLGIPRVSPFEIARQIRESNKNIKLTCSLRVRDRNLNDIEKIVQQSVGMVDGILVLMGDKSDTNIK